MSVFQDGKMLEGLWATSRVNLISSHGSSVQWVLFLRISLTCEQRWQLSRCVLCTLTALEEGAAACKVVLRFTNTYLSRSTCFLGPSWKNKESFAGFSTVLFYKTDSLGGKKKVDVESGLAFLWSCFEWLAVAYLSVWDIILCKLPLGFLRKLLL